MRQNFRSIGVEIWWSYKIFATTPARTAAPLFTTTYQYFIDARSASLFLQSTSNSPLLALSLVSTFSTTRAILLFAYAYEHRGLYQLNNTLIVHRVQLEMGDTPPPTFYDDVRAMFGDACAVLLPGSPTPTPINCFPIRVDIGVDLPHDIDENERIRNAGDDNRNEKNPRHVSAPSTAANDASPFFTIPVPQYPKLKTENKKKRIRRNLSIDTDTFTNAQNGQGSNSTPNLLPKKKSKKDGRIPLNKISGKNSATPRYLDLNTGFSFPFNPEDPNFEEKENFCYFQAASGASSIPHPQSAGLHIRAQQRDRSSHPRTAPAFSSFPCSSITPDPIPVCMVLYNLLEIKAYKASDEDIKVAYKKMGLIFHPDKVKDEVCFLLLRGQLRGFMLIICL
jgi:hypothetical protein